MSTKALHGLLDGLENLPRELRPPEARIAAARGELEAIGRAAKALGDGPPRIFNDDATNAWLAVGESIAKETK